MKRILSRLPAWMRGNAAKTFGLMLCATALTATLRWIDPHFQNTNMIYILAVTLVSRITTGYIWGIISSLLCVVGVNFFFTFPYSALDFTLNGYPLTFVCMLLVSFITSAVTAQSKERARQASLLGERAERLYQLTRRLLSTRSSEGIILLVLKFLRESFGHAAVFYGEDPALGGKPLLYADFPEDRLVFDSAGERAAAHQAFETRICAGQGTEWHPDALAYYIPVASHDSLSGVMGILFGRDAAVSPEQKVILKTIAAQVAMALEYQRLSDEQTRTVMESEREKMRSNLLRAISHDLRTPLTGILGASSVLLESGDRVGLEEREKLLRDIQSDSRWLIRMVENLLSVTRIRGDGAHVEKTMEAAEEIAAEAVSRIKANFPGRQVGVRVPEELLLVPMDATLIEQVMINLLENAIKHAGGGPVELNVRRDGQAALFEVRDHGRGLREEELPHLFDGYQTGRPSSDSSRGMGIGLSICKSIIAAHGGTIRAENHPDGGAVFLFALPLEGVDSL